MLSPPPPGLHVVGPLHTRRDRRPFPAFSGKNRPLLDYCIIFVAAPKNAGRTGWLLPETMGQDDDEEGPAITLETVQQALVLQGVEISDEE